MPNPDLPANLTPFAAAPTTRLAALGLAVLLALTGRQAAADEAVVSPNIGTGLYPASSLYAHGDDELLLDQIFQSHLPTTLEKYALRFSVHPHLGDWENKDYMRLTTNLRYGLTRNCEISVNSDLYFSHGNGAIRAFAEYGAADLQPGFKINLGQPVFPGWDTGFGADYQFPIGRPSPELTDGLRHLDPYVTFSHRLESRPDVRIFFGFHGDIIAHTSLQGQFSKNAFRESSTGMTGGWVIDRRNLHYTLEASFDTTRLTGHMEEDSCTIRPGILWEIPTRRDHKVMSHWMVGFALNETYGPGDNSLGASFRLRYSGDLKNTARHFTPDPAP